MSYVSTVSLNGPGGKTRGIFAGLDDRPMFGAVGGKTRGIFAGLDDRTAFVGSAGRRKRKGSSYVGVGDVLSDLMQAGSSILQDTTSTAVNDVENKGGDVATGLINSSAFKVVLDKVQQRAEDGVKKVAGRNAIALTAIAAGAGVVGATFLKGTIGMGLAAAIVGGGIYFIVKNSAASDAPTPAK